MLADRTGLAKELSRATARRSFAPVHDRGQVLVDVAVMLADGGEAIGDINVLRHQGQVLGPVASAPTVWRALDELTPAALKRIQVARARVRRHVWAQLPKLPASQVADTDLGKVVVLDVDATLVTAHSEKQFAAGTFKGGFGYHPLAVWCDNTQEMLEVVMRPGNAGSNTVADHVAVLTQAIAQVPAAYRKHMLIRADGAGSSHGLLDWLTEQGTKRGRTIEYSVGFASNQNVRDAIAKLPNNVWTAAVDADGDVRDSGDVAEITALMDLTRWPAGMRLIVRRERPTPAPNCPCSKRPTSGATRSSRPTPPPGSWRSWRPATGPMPGRGPHPPREGLRAGTVPVQGLRDQHRLGPARRDQRGPHRLVAAARPDAGAGQGRAQGAALPAPTRARQTDHRRAPAQAANPIELAMGQSNRERIRQHRRDTCTRLNDQLQPRPTDQGPRRTATRKRQPGLRHTHRPISRRPQPS